MNRRQWMRVLGLAVGASLRPKSALVITGATQESESQNGAKPQPLPLAEYEPTSMLHAQDAFVERAAFPVVDVHTHITVSAKSENGVGLAAERKYLGKPDELLRVMDRKNLRAMVNLTGGYDNGLVEVVAKYDKAFLGRFYSLTEPCYAKFLEPDYPRIQADAIERALIRSLQRGVRSRQPLKTLL